MTKPIDIDQIARSIYGGRLTQAMDNAVIAMAPRWGAARLQARQEAGYRRAMLAYAAASQSEGYRGGASAYADQIYPGPQRHSNWLPLTTEDALLPGYDRFQLITECRQEYRQDPLLRALVDGIARRVGSPKPHFHTDNEDWNKEAAEQYAQWEIEQADFHGAMTNEEMDEAIIRAQFTDGDMGEIFVDQGGDLRLQLIEADRIAPDYRMGINVDTFNPIGGVWVDWQTGRVEGYQVGRRGIGGILTDSQKYTAADMALYKRSQRVEQRRGTPLLAPVLNIAKDLRRYLNAVRQSMNAAASFGVFIKRNNAAGFALDAYAKRTFQNPAYSSVPVPVGKQLWLEPDEDVTQLDPKVPGPDFDPVSRFFVRQIARGAGTIYEMLMGDFSGMSYSSSKTILLFEWQMQNDWQDWLIRSRKRRVYNVWVSKRMTPASEGGLGTLPFNPQAFDKVSWIRAPRTGFDPLEDAEAIIKSLGAGTLTFRRYYTGLGLNEEVELRQAAKEAKLLIDLSKEFDVPVELISSLLAPGILKPGGAEGEPAGAGAHPGTSAGSAQPQRTDAHSARRGGAQD
jgi:capsid protein